MRVASIALISGGGGPENPKMLAIPFIIIRQDLRDEARRTAHLHVRYLGTLMDILPFLSFSMRTPRRGSTIFSTSCS